MSPENSTGVSERVSAPLRLVAHAACILGPRTPLSFAHPLARRMTPLQKALLEVAYRVEANARGDFERLVRQGGCALYFATALGELSSNLAMLEALRREELPLSPTAFQHSVHNCPVGYLSILMGLKNPMVTLCGGLDAAHKGLALGVAEARRNADPRTGRGGAVFVLAADELRGDGDAGEGLARAEALLLETCRHEDVEESSDGVFLTADVQLPSGGRNDAATPQWAWPWILGPESGILIESDSGKGNGFFPRASETRWIFRK